ncbi:DUF3151 domain-containing protein [Frigoribacterium sp. RIT-PI-h]|uniref:DUF3151 domain-containing protein n=1 Tax=Frigoribacterium sp. RIT-PI-h TaxID=1690245 RepID=UPI0006B93E28|nr:DUF3151 domain-containing protein [Frigoribacterium sp. RIT-PI-h]KPG86572.1 hypothetical protein AEQ27_03990 [Frigoribacterium sp. RIT-PI-h]
MPPPPLRGAPEPRLPAEPAVVADLESLTTAEVVTAHPTSSLAWALLSDEAAARGADLEAYAYARAGYHRGLDALRKAGWPGQGPGPWSHAPTRGVLRSLFARRRGAAAVGEPDEVGRLTTFLADADPSVLPTLEGQAG